MFAAGGVISEEELMTSFRRFGSKLRGDPTSALQDGSAAIVLEALAGATAA